MDEYGRLWKSKSFHTEILVTLSQILRHPYAGAINVFSPVFKPKFLGIHKNRFYLPMVGEILPGHRLVTFRIVEKQRKNLGFLFFMYVIRSPEMAKKFKIASEKNVFCDFHLMKVTKGILLPSKCTFEYMLDP